MDKSNKYITHERKVGPHVGLQSGLALFVVVMGALFYIDATPGIQSTMSIVTILFGMWWFLVHHGYEHWHHGHHHSHVHH